MNSALQRARATLAASELSAGDPAPPLSDADRELLDRYVDAFQRYDMDALTALIQEDARQSMPPYRHVAARPRRHPHLVVRARHRLPGLADDPDGRRQRLAGVRPVQAERRAAATSRGRCRCSSSQAAGSSSSRSSSTPRRCSRCSGCPPGSTGSTSASPANAISRTQLGRRVAELDLVAAPAGGQLQASEQIDRARRSRRRPLTSQTIGLGRGAVISPFWTRRTPRNHRRGAGDEFRAAGSVSHPTLKGTSDDRTIPAPAGSP